MKNRPWFGRPGRRSGPGDAKARGVLALVLCVVVAALLMIWLGYRATREWERSTLTAIETRGKEVLALLSVALERDMKGGHVVVLLPFNEPLLEATPLYDLADRFASGFARFPYVESFFVWKNTGSAGGSTFFFNRADRRPPWETIDDPGDPYPVVIRRDPPVAQHLMTVARGHAARGVPFAVFESEVAGVPYQTLVHLIYQGASGGSYGLVGLTVNLQWVRENYFANVIEQIQQIGGDQSVGIEIADEQAVVIARTGPSSTGGAHVRTFPLLFSDRALMSYALPTGTRLQVSQWQARVNVSNDAALVAVERGVARTLGLLALAGLVTLIGAAFTVRAARAADALMTLQSEFIASVTHEMKTPLALIRLAGDTFANGRYASTATIQEYGRLLTTEADHLTRLIDNVLCFARISDPERAYSFEQLDVLELIDESIGRFRPQLADLNFDVQLRLPIELPHVRADRAMLLQVIGNLIDNALKHGLTGRTLILSAHADEARVHIEVADRGEGIPPNEVSRVFEKFYRGKGARRHGTGLGLTIARRIVEEHGGFITINSVIGQGTSVDVALPVMTRDDRTGVAALRRDRAAG